MGKSIWISVKVDMEDEIKQAVRNSLKKEISYRWIREVVEEEIKYLVRTSLISIQTRRLKHGKPKNTKKH